MPSTLKPWTDFLEQQKSISGRLYSTFLADKQAFESVTLLKKLGGRLTRKKIANEARLHQVLQVNGAAAKEARHAGPQVKHVELRHAALPYVRVGEQVRESPGAQDVAIAD